MRSRPYLRETCLLLEGKEISPEHWLSRKLEIAWLKLTGYPASFYVEWPFYKEFDSGPCLYSGRTIKLRESDTNASRMFSGDWLVFGANGGYSITRWAAIQYWPFHYHSHRQKTFEWYPLKTWWDKIMFLVYPSYYTNISTLYCAHEFREMWLNGHSVGYVAEFINECEFTRLERLKEIEAATYGIEYKKRKYKKWKATLT